MGKKYSEKEIFSKFINHECLECSAGDLIYTGTKNNGWTCLYTCNNCGVKYEYEDSDMGQTPPYLKSDAKKIF